MRFLDDALTRLTLKNTAEVKASHLFAVGDYYSKLNQYNIAYYAFYQYLKYCPTEGNVSAARQRMMKIAPHVKGVRMDFRPEEINRTYNKDTMLFSEGEGGEELFIIQKGAVKIVKIVDNREVLLAVLKSGDIFGEMALLESKPRTASAIAYEDCEVMVVTRENFERMVQIQPQIIAKLTTLLADRIWFIYKQLANTMIFDPIGRMYDALHIQLERERIPFYNHQPYTFNFGPQELVNMVGLTKNDGTVVFRRMTENKQLSVREGRIYASDVVEITRQAEFYHKMQRIEQSRRDGSLWA
jgi:CRP-like cAMP-binding protein